jgi:2-deoxy-scyllo-inosamine dehydrogenase (SAM-dependent)
MHDTEIRSPLLAVEIEVNTRCNRSCSYCPVSVLPPPGGPAQMEWSVFARVIDQLAHNQFGGRLSYHFYNEPLLRRDLERFVRHVHEVLAGVTQIIYTNGDLLTDERYQALRDAGIDQFVVTRHDGTPMAPRPNQVVQMPADLLLSNRGGTMTSLPESDDHIRSLPCFAPSEMLVVTSSGDVLRCYEDAERQHPLGNLVTEDLAEIRERTGRSRLAQHLAAGDRMAAGGICARCTNVDHTVRGTSHLA